MNLSAIAFAVLAVVTIIIAGATMARELDLQLPAWTRTGDTSLGPQSVNWLVAIAFIAAVLICLF